MVSIEVSKTYQVVTEESAQNGKTSDDGYCFSPMLLRLKDTLNEIDKLGAFDISEHVTHIDLYSCDEEMDYRTGEATTYHIRVKGTGRVLKRLIKLISQK